MAWSDRQYNDQGPFFTSERKTGVFWLIVISVGVQLAVWLFGGGSFGRGTNFVLDWFSAEFAMPQVFQIWRYISYQFMHGSPFHLLVNMWMLYMVGRSLEPDMGRRNFIIMYLALGAVAAFGHPIFELFFDRPMRGVIGASGAVMGLVAVFGVRFAKAPMMFFFIPMTGAGVALCLIGLDVVQILAYRGQTTTAHGVHLMGALAGFIYARYGTQIEYNITAMKKNRERKKAQAEAEQRQAENAEMDRILEKISAQGMAELTDAEREFMKRQSERLKSRS